jgi:hypothetical protein
MIAHGLILKVRETVAGTAPVKKARIPAQH